MSRNRISKNELNDELKNDIYAVASTDNLGKIKVDGTTLTVDQLTGVASVIGGGLKPQPYAGNADDLIETGFYSVTGDDLVSRGFPLNLDGTVQVYTTEQGFVNQIYSYSNGTKSYNYTRGRTNVSTWGTWELLLTNKNLEVFVRNVYVDGSLGTDSVNNGNSTGAGAFKTIQYALNSIPRMISNSITINIASGTYNESVNISGFRIGKLELKGTSVTVNSLIVIDCDNVRLEGMTSVQGFIVKTVNYLTMYNCNKTASNNYIGLDVDNSKVNVFNGQFSNSTNARAIYCARNSIAYLDGVSGSNNTVGLTSRGSVIRKNANLTITGATAQEVSDGGQIL